MLITERVLRAFVQRILLEGVEDDKLKLSDLVKALPDTGTGDTSPKACFNHLVNESPLRVRWIKWLAARFLNVSSTDPGDSLGDALPVLAGYSKILQGIGDRYNKGANKPFVEAIDALLNGRSPVAFEKLNLREISAIKTLYDLPRDKMVLDRADESWKNDLIGAFGRWELYFPSNQRNSVNIAGYDPVTRAPYVAWCTARTAGSNLFNLYATQGIMLFYAIDRSIEPPTDPKSRISIGFSNGTLEATGRDNGETVDGANKGLTLKDLSRIFGSDLGVDLSSESMSVEGADDDKLISVAVSAHERSTFKITGGILGKAYERVVEHRGTHPIVAEVKAAGSDVEKFDQALKGLSTSEAADLASYILGHATEAVFRRAAEHRSDNVKRAVARFSAAPSDVLESLYTYAKSNGDKDMMEEFSRNTSVPKVLIDMLKNYFDADGKVKPIDNRGVRILREILSNPGLPAAALDETLRLLINNNREFFDSKIASNISEIIRDREMKPDTLKLIWNCLDFSYQTRYTFEFSAHPNAHRDVLYHIVRVSNNVFDLARVLSNPSADRRTIDEIGRRALAKPALFWLSRDKLSTAFVNNDLTPPEVLKYIAYADVEASAHTKENAKKRLERLEERGQHVTESWRVASRIIAELKKEQMSLTRDILQEQQTFNLAGYKPQILKFVDNVLNGRPNRIGNLTTVMYSIITNGDGRLAKGESDRLGFEKDFNAAWRKNIEEAARNKHGNVEGDTDAVWSHYSINASKYIKTSGVDLTLNFYVTVSRDRSSVESFMNNYKNLPNYLLPVSDRYKTPIGAKTHTMLDFFLKHNDSLKVYYYDKRAKDDVEKAVQRWLSDSKISTTPRTHTHAVDVKSKGGSYGQMLDRHIDDAFTQLIKKHGNRFTPEEYYQWLVKHWQTLMTQIKIQY